ncbi:kinase-like protein [Lojkania enalia]|uniref:Kinase-like protein n=1 Tax=Lojkania enalia TaxID=147567 RepID=A0A9P4N3N7_9PLEO|nr:kinase-like protein [Didymosphaeria enalia]
MSNPSSMPLRALDDVVDVPPNAVDLFPDKVGPHIFHLADRDIILKVAYCENMAEVEAMRFVSSHTSIPVPEVHEAYRRNGIVHIFMTKINGKPLGETWSTLPENKKAYVADQLRGYIKELRDLRGDFYGALWKEPCEDTFFSHLCLATPGNKRYGPYKSRVEYNHGLVEALTNSRPGGQLGEPETELIAKISTMAEDAIVFSHGDLHLDNILVDKDSKIVGIVDWGSASFSILGREFFEANLRARNKDWIKLLANIFPEDAKAEYDILKELDRSLVLYSGF